MPVTQDRLAKLRTFGLSEYAARAYLALLDLGTSEARDVSSISKVPQAKIYQVLEQLHEKGLVVILPEFPKKYVPVPFEDYLNRIYDEHTKAAEAIAAERKELTEIFAVVGDTDVGNRGFFTVIRGRRNVLAKIEEMVQETKREVVVLGTAGMAARSSHLIPELGRARDRGVEVRMLVPIDASTLKKLESVAKHADVRGRDLREDDQSRKVAIVVCDSEHAFLIHFVPDDSNLYAGKDIGVFTDQEAMVRAIQAIVEPHWADAPHLEARRLEIEEGREPEFSRIYTSESEARAALTRAIEAGAKEVLGVVADPVTRDADALAPIAEAAAKAGARLRAMLNVASPDAAAALGGLVAKSTDADVRHLAPRLVARQWLIDDREALFSISRRVEGGTEADLVVHTNSPAVVAALRHHFEALWPTALTLETRGRELELFPHLQPGDLGLGILFSQIEDAVLVADHEGRVLLWNPAATRVFGRDAKDAIGASLVDLASERSAAPLGRALARVENAAVGDRDAHMVVETTCVRGDGAEVEVEWLVSPIVEPGMRERLVLAIGRDITDSKRAKLADVRSQMEVVRIYERMNEAFYALDRNWRFVYRNPVTKRMQHSMPDEQIERQTIWESFPDLAGTKFDTEFHRAMDEMVPVSFEAHYPRMNRWFEVNAYPSPDGLSVYFRDITLRKQHETALREREAQHEQAESLARIGSWTWDVDSGALTWSAGMRRIFGVGPDVEATFDAWLARVHEDDRERVAAAVRGAADAGEGFEITHRIVRDDGEVRTLFGRGVPTDADAKGRPTRFVGIGQDVSAQPAKVPIRGGDARQAPAASRRD